MKTIAFTTAILIAASLSACTQQPVTPPATVVELQRVTSAKTPNEVAKFIYDNYGCHNCHTIGNGGRFGYTAQGEQLKTKSEGCVSMLTSVHRILALPDANRTEDHRVKLAHFKDYGCTACHKIDLGTVSLTEVGSQLKELHMACTDVQRVLNP